jgi:recombination associated protein RdgC
MDNVILIEEKEFLGREFLTWLWFKSETSGGHFDIKGKTIELWVGNRMVLSDSDNTEQVACKGENSELQEAKRALSQGKKVCASNFKLNIGDNEYSFTLDSKHFNLKSLKTPKIELNKSEDLDGMLFEKIFLIQEVVEAVEQLFIVFLQLRTHNNNWLSESNLIKDWYQEKV